MIDVPGRFRPHHPFPYPQDNVFIFEEWYFQHYKPYPCDRVYLPIFWTSFYVKHKYGKDRYAMNDLQVFIDGLHKSLKYYTIVQYDDGILHDLSGIDCFVFGMSGRGAHYNLPLICTPHKFTFPGTRRDMLVNFIGKITHPIRAEMIAALPKKPNYYISTQAHSLHEYCRMMARSVYTLCPRGYGLTSFRIQEAMQYGSIPLYISDKFVRPHNIDFAYECEVKDIQALISMPLDNHIHEAVQMAIHINYQKYFTYDANKKIIETLNSSPLPRPARSA